MIVFILSVLLLAWVSFTVGFCLIGTQLNLAKRIKKQLWNGRINLWWLSALFLLLNGVIEAGGVLAGVTGVPGKQAVEHKEYIE